MGKQTELLLFMSNMYFASTWYDNYDWLQIRSVTVISVVFGLYNHDSIPLIAVLLKCYSI